MSRPRPITFPPMARPTPFELVFQPIADQRFARIRASLAEGQHDPTDRDAFVMDREVVTLLREMRPDEGLGEAMDQMVALVHHAYLAWDAGAVTVAIGDDVASALLSPTPPAGGGDGIPAYYAQLPERLIWASVVEGATPEPMDGCFVDVAASGDLRVLGIFGLRPDRDGFSAVETAGPRPGELARPDGSPLFSSVLPGGAEAGLHSIVGEEELLELGWRTRAAAARV